MLIEKLSAIRRDRKDETLQRETGEMSSNKSSKDEYVSDGRKKGGSERIENNVSEGGNS